MLSHFLRVARQPIISYLENITNGTISSTYTFTLSNTTYPEGLYVVGVISEQGTASGRTLNSVSFAGTAMTSIVNTASGTGSGGTLIGAIYSINRTTSSTGSQTVSVVFSGTMTRANIGVWRINNTFSNTVFDTDTSSISGAASSRTNTVNALQYNAVGVSMLVNGTNNTTTWTNATERYDNPFASGSGGSGADFIAEKEGDRTITATATSGTSDGLVLVTAVWR